MKMEMAALYDVNVRTINEHIKKIYSDESLTNYILCLTGIGGINNGIADA